MDFSLPSRTNDILSRVRAIMRESVEPLEQELARRGSWRALLPELARARQIVKDAGLWAPQLPAALGGMGLTLMEHARVSEELGKSPLGHYVFNCQAPDAGNMEILIKYGTPEQKDRWLLPLARGE